MARMKDLQIDGDEIMAKYGWSYEEFRGMQSNTTVYILLRNPNCYDEVFDDLTELYQFVVGQDETPTKVPAPLSLTDLCGCGHERSEHKGKTGSEGCCGCECPSLKEVE